MTIPAPELVAVESDAQRDSASALLREYLAWVAGVASTHYGLAFDIDAMVQSDLEDRSKFCPPTGRFYLVRHGGRDVCVGCLKRLAPGVGEVQRMYIQPPVRGFGAGRALALRLIADARALGYSTLRLESLKALTAAHGLYRSLGFCDIDPYADNSMQAYQAPLALDAYRDSAVFMELRLGDSA
jgi:GNAT superfamily N-acetyltransferase